MILFLAVEEIMDMNRSRRLNFNAPFLSTKRHLSQEKLPGQFPEASVPFCWETTPGMPKNSSLLKNDGEVETPRLKLPPGRLKLYVGDENNDFDDVSESLTPAARLLRLKKRDNHETSQDTVDVLSLTQAIDMVQPPKESDTESDDGSSGGGGDSNDYLTMESTERSEDMSPSYIIERFLPDAAALAAVTSAASQRRNKKLSYLSATVRQSCFSPKACGLHVLLPWSTKHRICGVKNAFSTSSHVHLQPKFITKDN